MIRDLSAAEESVLQIFAREHGRRWKQTLRGAWMTACAHLSDETVPEYCSTLQRLRNDPDWSTRGLDQYRLPDGFTFRITR